MEGSRIPNVRSGLDPDPSFQVRSGLDPAPVPRVRSGLDPDPVPRVRSGLDPDPIFLVGSGLDPEPLPEPVVHGIEDVGSGLWLDPASVESLTAAEGQVFVDEAYEDLELNFGVRPRFDPNLEVDARITREGVFIGPSALTSEAELRTTLIHEGVRLQQWAEGRLGASGVHRTASELEARLRQLDPENVRKARLTPELQAKLIDDVRTQLDSLFARQADSSVYDVLVKGAARPPASSVVTDPPAWIPAAPAGDTTRGVSR